MNCIFRLLDPSRNHYSLYQNPSTTIAIRIVAGDQVLLIIEDDANYARILLDAAREIGLKGIILPTRHRRLDARDRL